MARKIRLRPWQKRALDRLAACDSPDFLAVATPGAGKTTFALCAAVQDLAENPGRRLVVVTPTSHSRSSAAPARWAPEPRWSPSGGRLPADVHGIVTTYQQVASNPALADRRPVDGRARRIHHAGDERAWGEAVRAFEVAPRRLALSARRSGPTHSPSPSSATSETRPYRLEYGYADGRRPGRAAGLLPRINGFMEWIAPDGCQSAAFDDRSTGPGRAAPPA